MDCSLEKNGLASKQLFTMTTNWDSFAQPQTWAVKLFFKFAEKKNPSLPKFTLYMKMSNGHDYRHLEEMSRTVTSARQS